MRCGVTTVRHSDRRSQIHATHHAGDATHPLDLFIPLPNQVRPGVFLTRLRFRSKLRHLAVLPCFTFHVRTLEERHAAQRPTVSPVS